MLDNLLKRFSPGHITKQRELTCALCCADSVAVSEPCIMKLFASQPQRASVQARSRGDFTAHLQIEPLWFSVDFFSVVVFNHKNILSYKLQCLFPLPTSIHVSEEN